LLHIIDGKKVDCKKAKKRETPVDPLASDPKFKTSKIFVGGLPQDLTREGLREYFSAYGDVVECVIVSDKETKASRCFGFVQFTTCGAVEEVMANYYNILMNGKWVTFNEIFFLWERFFGIAVSSHFF
jgi:RNA recognition motif-containing protein